MRPLARQEILELVAHKRRLFVLDRGWEPKGIRLTPLMWESVCAFEEGTAEQLVLQGESTQPPRLLGLEVVCTDADEVELVDGRAPEHRLAIDLWWSILCEVEQAVSAFKAEHGSVPTEVEFTPDHRAAVRRIFKSGYYRHVPSDKDPAKLGAVAGLRVVSWDADELRVR